LALSGRDGEAPEGFFVNDLSSNPTMSVREVAQALGVSERTVRRHAEEMGITRNGVKTYLTEPQVTEIKLRIERSGRNDLDNVGQLPKTRLEKALIIQQAMQLQAEEISELQEENVVLKKRVARMTHNNQTYTTTEVAKELGLKSAQELNKLLHEKGITYKDARGVWLLYSEYADRGFQRIKQKEVSPGVVKYYAEWTGIGRDWLIGIFREDA
jgi:phage antirepressor YoqD-like protein